RKGQYNMQVLGVGQVVEESEYPYDVQPPAATLNSNERAIGQSAKYAGKVLCYPEGLRDHIVFRSTALQYEVGSVHGEEQAHQYDLCDENVVRIGTRPAVEL